MCPEVKNGTTKASTGAHVLDGFTPEDAAKAIIKGGQKETFFVFNMDEAQARIQHFKDVMPRVQIFYAMKANDWEMMLKLAVSQGAGFDCASPGEITKILKLGVPPTSIIFALPTKTAEQMVFARKAGVKHTTFDSSYELIKIKKYWPDVNLLIRIRVDGESLYKLGDKFGCDFDTEAKDLLDEAATLGLKVAGVAFHVGSACWSTDSHSIGLQRAKALFDYERQKGRIMTIVDIGGGFLSATTDGIDKVAKEINKALEEYFPESSVQVIAEPGRYICDSSAMLYSNVCNVRKITKNNKLIDMIYIGDGLHGTLRYIEAWTTVEKLEIEEINKSTANNSDNLKEIILWGPTCDSTDRVMGNRQLLLPQCSTSDWLVFRIRGAYTYGFHGPFSSIEIPKMRTVISKELWSVIKDCPVFNNDDFVLSPDLFEPLPTSLPSIPMTKTNMSLPTPVLLD